MPLVLPDDEREMENQKHAVGDDVIMKGKGKRRLKRSESIYDKSCLCMF